MEKEKVKVENVSNEVQLDKKPNQFTLRLLHGSSLLKDSGERKKWICARVFLLFIITMFYLECASTLNSVCKF